MEDITEDWELDSSWIQTDMILPNLSKRASSGSQRGEFYYLTKVIGEGGLVISDEPGVSIEDQFIDNCYILVGCFVDKELKPRFVGFIDSEEAITIFADGIHEEALDSSGYINDIWFKEGTVGLRTRLWKVGYKECPEDLSLSHAGSWMSKVLTKLLKIKKWYSLLVTKEG